MRFEMNLRDCEAKVRLASDLLERRIEIERIGMGIEEGDLREVRSLLLAAVTHLNEVNHIVIKKGVPWPVSPEEYGDD